MRAYLATLDTTNPTAAGYHQIINDYYPNPAHPNPAHIVDPAHPDPAHPDTGRGGAADRGLMMARDHHAGEVAVRAAVFERCLGADAAARRGQLQTSLTDAADEADSRYRVWQAALAHATEVRTHTSNRRRRRVRGGYRPPTAAEYAAVVASGRDAGNAGDGASEARRHHQQVIAALTHLDAGGCDPAWWGPDTTTAAEALHTAATDLAAAETTLAASAKHAAAAVAGPEHAAGAERARWRSTAIGELEASARRVDGFAEVIGDGEVAEQLWNTPTTLTATAAGAGGGADSSGGGDNPWLVELADAYHRRRLAGADIADCGELIAAVADPPAAAAIAAAATAAGINLTNYPIDAGWAATVRRHIIAARTHQWRPQLDQLAAARTTIRHHLNTTAAHSDRANQDDTLRAWLNNGCHPAKLIERWTTLNHTAITNHQPHTTPDPDHPDTAHPGAVVERSDIGLAPATSGEAFDDWQQPLHDTTPGPYPNTAAARETTACETTARETTARETTARETTARETTARETTARETTARETTEQDADREAEREAEQDAEREAERGVVVGVCAAAAGFYRAQLSDSPAGA